MTRGRPCFSPRNNASEILDSHSDLTLPTVAPGQTRGRSVSSALPCISFRNRAEGTAGTFQRGKFPARISIRKRISQKLSCKINCAHRRTENSQRTASLDELAEPINYNKRSQTSSTHDFASHKQMGRASVNPTRKQAKRAVDAWQIGPSLCSRSRLRTHARRAPRLAQSVSSLYTTGFPIHSAIE